MTNEINLAENKKYLECIRKAYIEPIRTATVVDDRYPAVETIASNGSAQEYNPVDLDRLSKLIELCREENNSWGLEVSDGNTESSLTGEHINNSDLVVLDYDLEGDPDIAGEKARKCIAMLANNHHFNLVVIHTSGIDDDIENVYDQILASLKLQPLIEPLLKGKEIDKFLLTLSIDNSELESRLKQKVDVKKIFDVTDDMPSLNELLRSRHSPYYGLKDDLVRLSKNQAFEPTDLILWMVKRQFENWEVSFCDHRIEQLSFDWKSESLNWISSNRFFLTVVKKSNDLEAISEFPELLANALANSKPSPMLLLMAKIRNELEEHGFGEAIKIDGESDLQAAWLKNLLDAEDHELHRVGDKLVKNHWESIAAGRSTELKEFVLELSNAFKDYDVEALTKVLYRRVSSDQKKRIAEMNRYACSMHSTSQRLSTGLIICLPSEDPIEGREPWVVLSPACDLEPRDKAGWSEKLGSGVIPFKASRLVCQNLNTAIDKVNSNEYIFLKGEFESCSKAYHVHEDWEQMFALGYGNLNDNSDLEIIRLSNDQENSIGIDRVNGKIHGQLRYEYALNLLQRLGNKLSRVGLDFSGA